MGQILSVIEAEYDVINAALLFRAQNGGAHRAGAGRSRPGDLTEPRVEFRLVAGLDLPGEDNRSGVSGASSEAVESAAMKSYANASLDHSIANSW